MNADKARENDAGAGGAAPRVRRFGCLHVFLCGLGLVLLAVGYWYVKLSFARRDFQRHAEALVHAVEIERIVVAEGEDAGPLYRDAFRLYVQPQDCGADETEWLDLTSPSRALKVRPELLASYLKANEPYLQALERACLRPGYSVRTDYRSSKGLLSEQASKARRAVLFLTVCAEAKGREGKQSEAVTHLLTGLRVAEDIGKDRLMISRVVRLACEGVVVAGSQHLLQDGNLGEVEAARLFDALRRAEIEREGMELIIRTEEAAMLFTYYRPLVLGQVSARELLSMSGNLAQFVANRPGTTPEDGCLQAAKVEFWQRSGCAFNDAGFYEKTMGDYMAAASQPYPEALTAAETARTRAEKHVAWWALFSRDMLDAPVTVLGRDAQSVAQLRAARLALGCRLHKLKFGAYPERLAELPVKLPESFTSLPIDPFTGKEMLYERTATGCKVWSVGRNRRDDGGLSRAERDKNKPDDYDEVFELKR